MKNTCVLLCKLGPVRNTKGRVNHPPTSPPGFVSAVGTFLVFDLFLFYFKGADRRKRKEMQSAFSQTGRILIHGDFYLLKNTFCL